MNKDNNIVEQILADKGILKAEIQEQKNVTKFELTAENFFTDNYADGICSKEILGKALSNRESIESIKSLIEVMADGEKISIYRNPVTTKNGNVYHYIKILGNMGQEELKVPYFDGLSRLLKEYVKDTFYTSLKMADLYSELKNTK